MPLGWKAGQSLTFRSVPLHSGMVIMPPSREDYTLKNLELNKEAGQLAAIMPINGFRLIWVMRTLE